MFKKFWLDTILGFFFIVAFGFAISQMFASRIFDVFDPVGDAFADMESTDIVFSRMRENPLGEENLIIVNVGNLPRGGIADIINIINEAKPKVVGMDMFFYNLKEDTLGDMKLSEAFANTENLITVSKLVNSDEDPEFEEKLTSHPIFSYQGETAFANFITGAADQDDIKVCRTFPPSEMHKGKVEYALSVRMAMAMDSAKTQRFLDRGNDIEYINFRGNVFQGMTETVYPTAYFALDWYQVLNREFAPEMIENKAVLFCYLGSELGDRKALDDKYFTPLNKNYAGKGHADMFGGVVHANAFSMIMAEEYIDVMDSDLELMLGLTLLFLNVVLFTYIYKRLPHWYDGLTKFIQLIQTAIVFTIGLVIFNAYNYEIETTTAIILILFVGDALEVYFGVVKNLFTKEGRKELRELKKM